MVISTLVTCSLLLYEGLQQKQLAAMSRSTTQALAAKMELRKYLRQEHVISIAGTGLHCLILLASSRDHQGSTAHTFPGGIGLVPPQIGAFHFFKWGKAPMHK